MAKLGAGVRKRADGSLEKRFTVKGKRYSVYGKTQKEITEKEQAVRKKIDAGLYTDNRNITLDKYFNEWIANKRKTIKSSTIKTYVNFYRKHISAVLGGKRIQNIERREIQQFQSQLEKELAATTANLMLRIVKMILTDAVNDEIISKNPANGIKGLKVTEKAANTYHRALTIEEQESFMQEIKEDYYYEFIALLLSTGMRFGEAAALTWSDIDYKNNVIHIGRTLTYTENGEMIIGDTPKTEAGIRDIPMTDNIKELLSRQRAKMGNVVAFKGGNVFVSVYGCLISNAVINMAITGALKRLEEKGQHIEHFTVHALRDTFATRFIEQGGNPQTLKTILGHSSLAMTMDLYAHVLPNTKQQEMDSVHIAI